MKKILYLTVSKQWFDLIASGVKREEYREIKPYWIRRLFTYVNKIDTDFAKEIDTWINVEKQDYHAYQGLNFDNYTHVLFINGYGANRPRILKEIDSISIGKPKPGWCPKEFLDNNYFIIKLK